MNFIHWMETCLLWTKWMFMDEIQLNDGDGNVVNDVGDGVGRCLDDTSYLVRLITQVALITNLPNYLLWLPIKLQNVPFKIESKKVESGGMQLQ